MTEPALPEAVALGQDRVEDKDKGKDKDKAEGREEVVAPAANVFARSVERLFHTSRVFPAPRYNAFPVAHR